MYVQDTMVQQLTKEKHQLQDQLQSVQAAYDITECQRQDLLTKMEHRMSSNQVGVIRRERTYSITLTAVLSGDGNKASRCISRWLSASTSDAV